MTHPHETPEAQAALKAAIEIIGNHADMIAAYAPAIPQVTELRGYVNTLRLLMVCRCGPASDWEDKPICDSFKAGHHPHWCEQCAHLPECHTTPKGQ